MMHGRSCCDIVNEPKHAHGFLLKFTFPFGLGSARASEYTMCVLCASDPILFFCLGIVRYFSTQCLDLITFVLVSSAN